MANEDWERFAARLTVATQAWVTPGTMAELLHHWRGEGTGDDDAPCVALVRYASRVGCRLDEPLRAALKALELSEDEHRASARNYLPLSTMTSDQEQRQLAHLVQGLIAAVRAAIAWTAGQEADAIKALSQAARHYGQAWPLTNLTVEPPKNPADDHTDGRKSQALLGRTVSALSGNHDRMSVSTWLILERLLAVLFHEPVLPPDQTNTPKVLFFLAGNTANHHCGVVQPLTIHRRAHSMVGLLVDPLAFGVTLLDEAMCRSLRLAFRVARQSLFAKLGTHRTSFTLELTGTMPDLVAQLVGESAGGLLGVGLYATAYGMPLDAQRSATMALSMGDDVNQDDAKNLPRTALKLGSVRGIEHKLAAAAFRDTGLRGIALTEKNRNAWVSRHGETASPRTEAVSNFESLLNFLVGDRFLEEELAQHAREVAAEWERIEQPATAQHDTQAGERQWRRELNETLRFDCYVPPDYRLEPPRGVLPGRGQPGEAADPKHPDAPVPGAGDEALRNLLALTTSQLVWSDAPQWLKSAQAKGPRSLVVYDNAGSGKTVFTHRLRHVAADVETQQRLFNNRPPLVVRWEGVWPRDGHGRRLSLVAALEQQFARDRGWGTEEPLPEYRELVRQCVDYALRQERVVVILDGFDQFSAEDEAHILRHLDRKHSTETEDAAKCRWVLAGRVHSLERHLTDVFDDRHFQRIRIEPFTAEQQDRYFERRTRVGTGQPIGRAWLETLGVNLSEDDHETIAEKRAPFAELLGLPMTLWLIGQLIDLTPVSASLPRFESLSDLAYQVASKLLDEARRKNRERIVAELQRQGVAVPGFQDEADEQGLLQHVLTLIAFQLMLERNYNGRVPREDLSRFEDACRDRWFHDHDLAENQPGLIERQKRDLRQVGERLQREWDYALAVLKTIELSHRSVTEVFGPQGGLAFRSRKMVEFHAAWYLAKFATDWDRTGGAEGAHVPGVAGTESSAAPETAVSAWSYSYDETEWSECWRLVSEMPVAGRDEAVWAASLGVLFRPVGGVPPEARPKHPLRPTRLIFETWRALKRANSACLAGILADYRRPFDELLRTGETEQARLAAALIPLEVLRERVTVDQRFAAIQPPADEPAYVRCPPQGATLTFMMGSKQDAPGADSNEYPRHEVTIPAFLMATCTVTRAQYRWFDPALEQRYAREFEETAPDDDCPVIETNWFDGMAFALWLGEAARLPTETQWEGAARAGYDGPNDVIGIPPYHAGFTNEHVNYDGGYPLKGQPKSGYLGRTLPVRWTEKRQSGDTDKKLRRHPAYRPNDWDIWQAHGNVWEWCVTEYDGTLYQRRLDGHPDGDLDDVFRHAVGVRRVVRGGSWNDRADYVRSAYRVHNDPDGRGHVIGLRLSWRVVAVRPESSL